MKKLWFFVEVILKDTKSFIKNTFTSKVAGVTNAFRGHFALYVILFLSATKVLAQPQSFPVQVIPQTIPPAPIFLSEYADDTTINSPVRVQIILNDFTLSNREVRLKAFFEGNGIAFQSNTNVVGASPIFLEGGIPTTLTNVELAPYFRFENITGISPNVYGQPIPEGAYQFCFEVFDVLTGRRLSARSCATTVIFKNEPPFLVSPLNKTNIEQQNPQNIVFQWTPRHINVSNVEYELSIVEIWDSYVDPQTAFLSSPPVFQTTTTATTYVYGPADPLFLSNKKYAWRVQAIAKQGTEEIGLFKNQGYSEIYSFSYATPCEVPQSVSTEIKGAHQVNISWDDYTTEIPKFNVRYRKQGDNGEWFFSQTSANWVTLWDLRANTTYEYQVNKICAISESNWSTLDTFTTAEEQDESSLINCGIPPDINLENQDPIPSIETGETFMAGDFAVKILEVSGGEGRFTGKGYVTVPYLKSIKVAVEFTNVLINTDKQLAQGTVITTYDPTLSNIVDVDEAIDTVTDIVESVGEIFEGDNDLDEININFDITEENITIEDGRIVITNPDNGERFDYPLGDDTVITDASGDVYHVDEQGNVTQGGIKDEGGIVSSNNVDGVSRNGELESLTAPGLVVSFKESGTFGFDQVPENQKDKLAEYYVTIKDSKGEDYTLVHQAVQKGQNTTIIAEVQQDDTTYELSDIVFKTKQGEKLPAEVKDNGTIEVTVNGHYTFENETIYAVVPSKTEDNKQLTAGAFTLWHLTERKVDIVLVPVNDASIDQAITDNISKIFKKGVATLNISIGQTFSFDKNTLGTNGLDVGDSPWLTAFNEEQKAIATAFRQAGNYNKNTYYVFVFNDITPSKDIAGFMPLQRQYGFVFTNKTSASEEGKGDVTKTIAHEIGHGVFALQHPFTKFNTDQGATNWLMDYGNGDLLSHMNWAQIHNPELKFYIFQDEEDGEKVGEGYANYVCIDTELKKELLEAGYHFYDMKGDPIVLNTDYLPLAFMGSDEGEYYGRVGAIGYNNHSYLYGIYKKDGKPVFSGRYLRSSIDLITPQEGDISRGVLVKIDESGNYKIVRKDGTVVKSGKTQEIKCPFSKKEEDVLPGDNLIARGLSEEKIILDLSEGIDQSDPKYEEIKILARYLKNLIKESKWAFLYKYDASVEDYSRHYGRNLLVKVLKDKEIFTVSDFKQSFEHYKYTKDDAYYIDDIDVLISNFDPWEGIPEDYNKHTFDYTSFDVPDLMSREIIESQLDIIEDLFTSITSEYPDYFTDKQKKKFIDFINNRRTDEGIEIILKQKLSQRKQFIAAYQALGAYEKYHYSIKDFKVREFLEATGNYIGEIKRNEAAGTAIPIHISEGYDQYVALHNSESAFFYGIQFLKMYGDLLEFEVIGNAVVKAQKALSKNFKKFKIPTKNQDLTKRIIAVENKVTGFNKAVQGSSQTVKDNVRTLRKWAKSKGYTKKAGSGSNSDTPEVWGEYKNGQFTEKVRFDHTSGDLTLTAKNADDELIKIKFADGSEVNANKLSITNKIEGVISGSVSKTKIIAKLDRIGGLDNAKNFLNRLDNAADAELLRRLDKLSDTQLQKLDELYSSKNFQLPGNRPVVNGKKATGDFTVKTRNDKYDVYFNKYGYADFLDSKFGPGREFALKTDDLTGGHEDFSTATKWLKNKFKNDPNIKIKSKSTNVELTINGKTNTYTWHHHEDGKTIMLVVSDAHNQVAHTGGASIIAKYLKGLFKSPY
ncbi:HNH endonuclease [Aquimarina sp. D1M17]|uniref:HNH endonuclease n=1 Tax=Aquimarina acroporae TaxID=2937283 RepID=UPI0020C13788|nr:HNH endonuclease [Aquimarina acroporae]MCK8524402.1 HNH endonuclease [Aquimarina acroporae]